MVHFLKWLDIKLRIFLRHNSRHECNLFILLRTRRHFSWLTWWSHFQTQANLLLIHSDSYCLVVIGVYDVCTNGQSAIMASPILRFKSDWRNTLIVLMGSQLWNSMQLVSKIRQRILDWALGFKSKCWWYCWTTALSALHTEQFRSLGLHIYDIGRNSAIHGFCKPFLSYWVAQI